MPRLQLPKPDGCEGSRRAEPSRSFAAPVPRAVCGACDAPDWAGQTSFRDRRTEVFGVVNREQVIPQRRAIPRFGFAYSLHGGKSYEARLLAPCGDRSRSAAGQGTRRFRTPVVPLRERTSSGWRVMHSSCTGFRGKMAL